MFLETSALTGENVEEAFLKCARTILNKIESGVPFIFFSRFMNYLSPEGLWVACNNGNCCAVVQIPQSSGPEAERRSLVVRVKMALSCLKLGSLKLWMMCQGQRP